LHRWLRRLFVGIHGVVVSVFLVLFGVTLYLSIGGVPAHLIEPLITRLHDQGLIVQVDRVHLDLLRGVAAEGFRFYDAPGRPAPMLEVRKVTFNFNPLEWFRGRHGLRHVWLDGAIIRVDTRGELQSVDSARTLVLDRANLQMRIETNAVVIGRMDMSVLGIKVHGQGRIFRETAVRPRMTLAEMSRFLSNTMRTLPLWLPSLAEELNAVGFDMPPQAEFSFTLYPTNPLRTTASVSLEAAHTQLRGISFDKWNAGISLTNGRLSVGALSAQYGKQRCDVSATLELTNRVLEARVFSDLPPEHWIRLVPKRWSAQLAQLGIEFKGVGSFEVWCGPAPVGELAKHLAGWVSLVQCDVHGIWIEKGFASFKIETNFVNVTKVDAVLGKGREQGAVRATAAYHFDTKVYTARGRTETDPHILLPITTRNQARIIRSFEFVEKPPTVDLEVSGVIGRPKDFQMTGHVWATNFTRYGAAIVSMDTPLAVTNGVLTMTPMVVVRTDGCAEGALAIDMDNGHADFDAVSSVDPYALAAIIDPKAEQILKCYRFEGPTRVAAKGRVDFDGWEETDFTADVRGERMGIQWLLADKASFHLRGVGARLDFTDVEGQIYGGSFGGSASFEGIDQPTNTRYEISGYFEDADFQQLVSSLKPTSDREKYTGRLTGNGTVRGIIGQGRGNTVTGEGKIKVAEGRLFQLPLLGGLSRLLSMIYPGLGFATQTAFESSFTIAGGKFHSDDLFLKGTLVSISGQGDYYLDSRLDVNVQVQLLRSGTLASILRLITYPVTKLLEFHLGGNLDQPRWRPVNLPKELFLIFD
jgi:hypothetical protein